VRRAHLELHHVTRGVRPTPCRGQAASQCHRRHPPLVRLGPLCPTCSPLLACTHQYCKVTSPSLFLQSGATARRQLAHPPPQSLRYGHPPLHPACRASAGRDAVRDPLPRHRRHPSWPVPIRFDAVQEAPFALPRVRSPLHESGQ